MSFLSHKTINHYQCTQLFGYKARSEKAIDEDHISAMRFDQEGDMLAVGDRAGRVIVFSPHSKPQVEEQDTCEDEEGEGEDVSRQEYEYYF